MRKAGEGPGHPFRGNQYSSGSGGGGGWVTSRGGPVGGLFRTRADAEAWASKFKDSETRVVEITPNAQSLSRPQKPRYGVQTREQVVRNRIASGQGMPREAKAYRSNYRGFDPTADYGGQQGHHVFEFQDEKGMNRFLNDVGGAPHPLGGLRTVLSDRKRTR